MFVVNTSTELDRDRMFCTFIKTCLIYRRKIKIQVSKHRHDRIRKIEKPYIFFLPKGPFAKTTSAKESKSVRLQPRIQHKIHHIPAATDTNYRRYTLLNNLPSSALKIERASSQRRRLRTQSIRRMSSPPHHPRLSRLPPKSITDHIVEHHIGGF